MAAALSVSSIPKPTQTLSFSSSRSNIFNPNSLVMARSRTRFRTQKRLTCTCLFGLGVPELVVIAGVAALVFGPKKLPEVGRSIGKTVKSFQQGSTYGLLAVFDFLAAGHINLLKTHPGIAGPLFVTWNLGIAAKEFESELKKEPDSAIEAPAETPTTVSEEKKDVEVSSQKESQ